MIYYKVKCNYSYAEGLGEREQKRIWEDISIDIRFGETFNQRKYSLLRKRESAC